MYANVLHNDAQHMFGAPAAWGCQDCVGICVSRPHGQELLNEFSSNKSTTEVYSPQNLLGNRVWKMLLLL